MSLTTRCPACGTTFRVVPDQLKISDGWVRCGHCADVFDATLFLEGEMPPVATQPPPPPPPSPPSPPAPASPHPEKVVIAAAPPPVTVAFGGGLLPEGARTRETDDGAVDSRVDPLPVPEAAVVAAEDSFEEELRRFASARQGRSPEPAPSEPVPPPAPTPTPTPVSVTAEPPATTVSSADLESLPAGEAYALPPAPEHAPDSDLDANEDLLPQDEPSFVRQARRKAFWHARRTRMALRWIGVVLGLVLLGQIALHERDNLAARVPATRGWLAALCRPLGCRIGPVHQIEAVVIDSTNLVRRQGDAYAFDLVLKNTAPVPVAFPALELTFTDTRNAVIARRVFLPADLPGAPTLLPAQGSQSLSLNLSITIPGVSSMSGYRALVFYP